MKLLNKKINMSFVLINSLLILLLQQSIYSTDDLYSQSGDNWEGLCKLGKFQSPINIIHNQNTKNSRSRTTFNYSIPKSNNSLKPYFDGSKLYLEGEFGTITHYNEEGTNEIYKAYRIEFHVSAEHYITKYSQTPKYSVEIQIFHNLLSSENPQITNKVLSVRQSIVSILLDNKGDTQDLFLESLGISRK